MEPNQTLLTLPLEIRHRIYEYLSYQTHDIRHDTGAYTYTNSITWITPTYYLKAPKGRSRQWTAQNWHHRQTPVMCALHAVSSQLCNEIQDYVHFPTPKIKLHIATDLDARGRERMPALIKGVLKSAILTEGVTAAALQFYCLKTGVKCRYKNEWGGARHVHLNNRTLMFEVDNLFDRAITRLLPHNFVRLDLLRTLAQELERFERLEYLSLRFNHGDLLEWFGSEKTSITKVETLEPFLKKGGKVSIKLLLRYDSLGMEFDGYYGLARVLENSKGGVRMEGRSNTRRRLVLKRW